MSGLKRMVFLPWSFKNSVASGPHRPPSLQVQQQAKQVCLQSQRSTSLRVDSLVTPWDQYNMIYAFLSLTFLPWLLPRVELKWHLGDSHHIKLAYRNVVPYQAPDRISVGPPRLTRSSVPRTTTLLLLLAFLVGIPSVRVGLWVGGFNYKMVFQSRSPLFFPVWFLPFTLTRVLFYYPSIKL